MHRQAEPDRLFLAGGRVFDGLQMREVVIFLVTGGLEHHALFDGGCGNAIVQGRVYTTGSVTVAS